MGIPYYQVRKKPGGPRGYWEPCLARPHPKTGTFAPTLMAKLGFKCVPCGPDGPDAWAIAEAWNRRWKAARAAHRAGRSVPLGGVPEQVPERERRVWPANSLGEAFAKYRATGSWLQSKAVRTREDWWRGWDLIAPVFGDLDPATVSFEQLDLWYFGNTDKSVDGLLDAVGVREAHRAMKIWRAMWIAVAGMKRADGRNYCLAKEDPSLAIRRKTPKARSAIWREGEAVRLVKGAIRMQFHGLAAALAVAWDSLLSPIDVVSLSDAQLAGNAEGPFYALDRTKTGQAAIATLGKRTQRLLAWYRTTLPPNLLPSARIFYTRGGAPVSRPDPAGGRGGDRGGGRPRPPAPYRRDKLGKDFAIVRAALFPGDTRKLMDFRRSGAVEALAGNFQKGSLNAKMANTIEDSPELQRTYLPGQAAVVRLADAARVVGRAVLRGSKETK